MTKTSLFLLLLLNICHWAGDYTHLSKPYMLKAKQFGTPLFPIFIHACIHTILMAFILIFFGENAFVYITCLSIELISHFMIDVLKGKLNKWIPSLQDNRAYPHWYIFGLDQFLHQGMIILICYLTLS